MQTAQSGKDGLPMAIVPIATVFKTPDHLVIRCANEKGQHEDLGFEAFHPNGHERIKSYLKSRPMGKILHISSEGAHIIVFLNQGQVDNFGLNVPPTLNMGTLYACSTGAMYFHPHLNEDNVGAETFMAYLGFPTLKILCDIRFIRSAVRAEKSSKLNPVYTSICHQIATRVSGMSIINTDCCYAACLYVSANLDVFIKNRCCCPEIFEQLHAKVAGLFANPDEAMPPAVEQKSLCSHTTAAGLRCQHVSKKNSDVCAQHEQAGIEHETAKETVLAGSDEDMLCSILLTCLQKSGQQFDFLADRFNIATNHELLLRLVNEMKPHSGINTDVVLDHLMRKADNDTLLCLLKTLRIA